MERNISTPRSFSRRDFIKATSAVSLAAVAGPASVFAAGEEKIRVGVIGCGGRGTGATIDCLRADPAVEVVAMGDLFQDRLDGSLRRLKKDFADRVKVTPETMFTGFDNYKKVCAIEEVDLIVTAAPPHFRPIHLEECVRQGKHVFMEKPVCVDAVGARKVIEASKQAKAKKLGIVAGTQRRHQASYIEAMKRIHDGAIGEIVGGQCYWNMGGLWVKEKKPEWSEMEWQCRNWLYFTWLSGDHIVEQHVHNIDVINWAMGGPPKKAMGMGGREVRTEDKYGNIFDHFAIEFEYDNGARVMSMCRQTPNTATRVSERLVGTKGVSDPRQWISGENEWRFSGEAKNPYVVEHADLIASIRAGEPLNEGQRVAESCLTAIMGRMSAYTGKALSWKWLVNASKLDLSPEAYEFGPVETRPAATPGKTPLI
ncbi:putative oxidoreductase YvaA [Anaerohalosphaera lusitana]|uniref:Putative oxidoreductase YvaA n=1 Tax=Anaerohalosphaera lusitana TaxID=1936003 RepID=A0A1U9NGP1_9BACT|nr:Gfo/Idh/MocA family oxidoreductase [Anaerohalosphaera lusitana]AQT66975.1 putative oxidoreductase YvaA [Anaerohalosphaera lusitana]